MIATAVIAATARQATRQPSVSISHCIAGSRTTEATPTPAKASPIARPRFRTNQLGRNIEWEM